LAWLIIKVRKPIHRKGENNMKLSAIEKQVVANMHNLPLDKQQVILELSAFFIQKKKAKKTEK
jgi:hypothetical protein